MIFLSILLTFFSLCGLSNLCFAYNSIGFEQFKTSCANLSAGKSSVSYADFVDLVHEHARVSAQQHKKGNWFKNTKPRVGIFDPFVLKLVVEPGAQCALFGDLHGNIKALLSLLDKLKQDGYLNNEFTIIKPNFYMLFLGDFVDRGANGVEVLYLLLCLKIANPDRVILVRGNHEDVQFNAQFGFGAELFAKFKKVDWHLFDQLYNLLPVAVYLGCGTDKLKNFILCCHGGIEPGFDPAPLLNSKYDHSYCIIGRLNRQDWFNNLSYLKQQHVKMVIPENELQNFMPILPTMPTNLGFMWFDFIVEQPNLFLDYTLGRGWAFGKDLVADYFKQCSSGNAALKAVFRAHQHNPAYGNMLARLNAGNGIATLWQGMVHTLLAAPVDGDRNKFAAFTMLTMATEFNRWRIDHKVIK